MTFMSIQRRPLPMSPLLMIPLSRRTFGRSAGGALGTFAILRHARGEQPFKIRCSLDTAPSHIRNVSVTDFLAKVQSAAKGQIVSEVFDSGQLFSDLAVAKALMQGQVEMAAPGAWTLTGTVPDGDFVQLPVFYGRSAGVTHKAADGRPGAFVMQQLESRLGVKAIGTWIDLGFQNFYTTKKPLNSADDLRGLKIRSPGGTGVAWRIARFGAAASTMAWPDVPQALSRGAFDGFVSTNESCASAKLWEAEVRYSYQDRQYLGQYIPLVNRAFWDRLGPEMQKIVTDTWAANVASYRSNASEAQARARDILEDHGIAFTDPSEEILSGTRTMLQADAITLVRDAKLSNDILRLVEESTAG
jgi:C4-dicarboxylate-binding protein DctP